MVQTTIEEEAEAFDFRLFSTSTKKIPGAAEVHDKPQKIVIKSPSPENGDPGFTQPRRPESYYFTGVSAPKRRQQYEEVAVSAQEVLNNLGIHYVHSPSLLPAPHPSSLETNHSSARPSPPMARPDPQTAHPNRPHHHLHIQQISPHYQPHKETQRQKTADPHPRETGSADRATEGQGDKPSGKGRRRPREENAAESREESKEKGEGEGEESAGRGGGGEGGGGWMKEERGGSIDDRARRGLTRRVGKSGKWFRSSTPSAHGVARVCQPRPDLSTGGFQQRRRLETGWKARPAVNSAVREVPSIQEARTPCRGRLGKKVLIQERWREGARRLGSDSARPGCMLGGVTVVEDEMTDSGTAPRGRVAHMSD